MAAVLGRVHAVMATRESQGVPEGRITVAGELQHADAVRRRARRRADPGCESSLARRARHARVTRAFRGRGGWLASCVRGPTPLVTCATQPGDPRPFREHGPYGCRE